MRPSLLTPLWRAAAFALGAGTALMGDKAAHACTDAVEEVIGEHYAGQIEELKDRDPALAEQLSAFRDDELKHQSEAVREGAREAPGYGPLSALIKAGCRAAIRTAEKKCTTPFRRWTRSPTQSGTQASMMPLMNGMSMLPRSSWSTVSSGVPRSPSGPR